MLYPADIDTAAEEWNANCGPAALAAILERSLADTRSLLEGFEKRRCMNVTAVLKALRTAKVVFKSRLKTRPSYGLVFIQWGGHEKKPAFVQYKFTHWIAIDGDTVFEINSPRLLSWDEWQQQMPLMAHEEGWGDGTFCIRSAIEIFRTPSSDIA